MRHEVESPGEACSSGLHLMFLSSNGFGAEEAETAWNLGGDGECGR
jgi:hypothetical protein